MLVDESATATVKQLGDALTEMEVNGHVFGRCSLTVVLHHEDRRALDHQAAQAMKVLAAHDGAFFDETYNLLNAWLSIVPGNGARNLRRLALLETHAADLSFLFGVDQGQAGSPLLSAPLATFETPHQTPFAYHLHVQDVGHTLVLGATGSGKSFLLNFLVTNAQQYDPFTIVLDLGHGYRKLAALLHGGYVELGLRQRDVSINPFCAGANARAPALPARVRPRPARRRRRLPPERARGPRGLRSGREPVRARPKSAPALHAREPAATGA